jgi:hypothetical protein
MVNEPGMDGDAVPAEFVAAGAPDSFAEWTDEQRDAYFRGDAGELIEGETPPRLDALPIGTPEW